MRLAPNTNGTQTDAHPPATLAVFRRGWSVARWVGLDLSRGQVFGLGRPVDVQGDRDRLLVTRASRPHGSRQKCC